MKLRVEHYFIFGSSAALARVICIDDCDEYLRFVHYDIRVVNGEARTLIVGNMIADAAMQGYCEFQS